MKTINAQTSFIALIIALAMGGLAATLCSAESESKASSPKAAAAAVTNAISSSTNSVESPAKLPEAKKAAVKKKLTGAELYSMHCNRCHPERYPTERTAAQWRTILLHMQIRANLPGTQAKMILTYLQENSGR